MEDYKNSQENKNNHASSYLQSEDIGYENEKACHYTIANFQSCHNIATIRLICVILDSQNPNRCHNFL